MPMPRVKSMVCALIKIIVSIITAEEESNNSVMNTPVTILLNKFEVYFCKIWVARSVNNSSKTLDNCLIAYMNNVIQPMIAAMVSKLTKALYFNK